MKQEIIRKLIAAVAMSLVVGVSLAACGGGSSSTAAGVTKTGSAEGFGGAVTATLTVDANGTVTDCKLEGAQETESIGGAALEELSKQVVAANGPAIDGVAGATVTTKAVRKAVAAALGVELAEEAPADSAAAAPAEPAAIVPVEGGIQIGQAYAAAHGTKCFTEAVAVVKDDVILAAYLDDFQFTSTDAGVTAVPNSDSDFAAGYAEGKVLMSKRTNADYYSKMMAEKGGSTVALDANFDAIQNFAVGKTISELEDVAAKGAEAVDAVSGATLVDTAGYLSAIVDAAKNAQTTQAVEFNGSSEDLKLNVVYGAAHGTKCFTSGAVATAGDTIVLSYIDEFQFAGSDAGVVGVPNSDSDFGAGYAEGKVLMSKRVNADYYSKMMAEKAGSTVSLDANYDAIQNHVNGMSIADAEALSKDEKAVDAVSGATGYSVTVDNGTPQTVTDNAFTATGLTAGTSHDFSVVALAALAADNSDAATLQSKTLYVRIAAVTTSSIILEWEQAGDVSQYTVAIEEEGDPSRSARFTYDWSKASGYGSIPLRFAFNYVGTEWASAALSPSASYRLRVKAGAADSDSAWSNDITGTVARRTAPAGEVFYEDFDRFMGGDAVMTAVGVKSAKKVTSEAGLSTMLTEFTYTDWSAGGGAMNAGSGTYGDPYRLMFFKDDGWETGALVTGNGVHNAFCGSFRLGGDNANQSYIQTPAMSGLTAAANVTVTFKTAVNVWTAASTTAPAVVFKAGWCRDQFESMELYVVHGDGTKVKVCDTIAVGDAGSELAWKSHSVAIEGLLPTDKLMFTSVGAKKSRYYIDEISVVKN